MTTRREVESKRAKLEVAERAIAEHARWVERNAARAALRAFYVAFTNLTGEWITEEAAEPDELAEWNRLRGALKETQRNLATARAATRRTIRKAYPPASPDGGPMQEPKP